MPPLTACFEAEQKAGETRLFAVCLPERFIVVS
jgi:hypothetical protein